MYTVHMQKAISLLTSVSVLSAVFLGASPASASCMAQYPTIGTISSVTSQGDYYRVKLDNLDIYNSSTFATDRTNIDQYNNLATAYKQNNFHVPQNLQYKSSGNVPA